METNEDVRNYPDKTAEEVEQELEDAFMERFGLKKLADILRQDGWLAPEK